MLISMLKNLVNTDEQFAFPSTGEHKMLDLISEDSRYKFIVDVNRKGYINISKRAYQARYRKDIVLLRLDVCGPPHANPDGVVLSGNHLHVYKEGYEDKIAIDIPDEIVNPDDMYQTLIDFLVYFKTLNINKLKIQVTIE